MSQSPDVLEQQLSAPHQRMLDEKTRWAKLSTIDPSGFPHTVPLGFRRVGHLIVMRVRNGTQKVRNLEVNPKASVLIDTERSEPQQRGLLLRGMARVWDEQGAFEAYLQQADGGAEHPVANWKTDTAFITFETERCSSWALG